MCLGIPGQIVEITDAVNLYGIVSVSGVRREVNLACVVNDRHPIQSCRGDWVLVHVGFAMSRIDEAEAARTLQLLAELGEMQQQLEELQSHGAEARSDA
jgi:hydrogenase expression/formation protein HypC